MFISALAEIVRAIATDPAALIADIALTSADSAAAALEFADGGEPQRPSGTVADLLAAQFTGNPDGRALVLDDREVTYGELGARVNTLAAELIAMGVGPRQPSPSGFRAASRWSSPSTR